jgi:hypothetical protein
MGESPLHFNKIPVYTNGNNLSIAINNNRVYGMNDTPQSHRLDSIMSREESAILITDCKARHGAAKGNKALLLLNADEDGDFYTLVDEIGGGNPCVSFECVGQMFKGRKDVINMLADGELILLDYTPEERISLTASEKKKFNGSRKNYPLPPKPGFAHVGEVWHRSGSCLFQHVKSGTCYIFGQDEGSYFGCELPKAAKTIQGAYNVLTPKEIGSRSFQRQGEWFAVIVQDKDVPEPKDCAMQFNANYDSDIFLPLDTPESNKHKLVDVEGRVGKDGQIYVKDGQLDHDQHAGLYFSGDSWTTFYRNTAVRSVSQQGVD